MHERASGVKLFDRNTAARLRRLFTKIVCLFTKKSHMICSSESVSIASPFPGFISVSWNIECGNRLSLRLHGDSLTLVNLSFKPVTVRKSWQVVNLATCGGPNEAVTFPTPSSVYAAWLVVELTED